MKTIRMTKKRKEMLASLRKAYAKRCLRKLLPLPPALRLRCCQRPQEQKHFTISPFDERPHHV